MTGLARAGIAALLVASTASAGMTTTVALRTQDAELPKLGLPSLRIEVHGTGPVAPHTLRGWMADDLIYLSHAKDGAGDPSPDYTLVVRFLDEGSDSAEVAFEATLVAHDGTVAWIADGRTTPDGAAPEPTAWRTIGRNVIAALFRDGWLQPKYDPNNPPPAAPTVERKAAAPR